MQHQTCISMCKQNILYTYIYIYMCNKKMRINVRRNPHCLTIEFVSPSLIGLHDESFLNNASVSMCVSRCNRTPYLFGLHISSFSHHMFLVYLILCSLKYIHFVCICAVYFLILISYHLFHFFLQKDAKAREYFTERIEFNSRISFFLRKNIN